MKTEEEPQALLHSVLRLSPEPCNTITETEVHRLLTTDPLGYYRFVLGELRDLALGRTDLILPPKQIFVDAENA